jgi:hypothetical protein
MNSNHSILTKDLEKSKTFSVRRKTKNTASSLAKSGPDRKHGDRFQVQQTRTTGRSAQLR